MTKLKKRYSTSYLSQHHALQRKKRSEKKVAFRPPLIAKVLLPPLDPPSRACSTDLSPSRDRVRATRFPPLPVSCVSEAGKKETPPSAYLGTSFPREHSYWSLQLQASSGLLLFDSYSSQNTFQLIR